MRQGEFRSQLILSFAQTGWCVKSEFFRFAGGFPWRFAGFSENVLARLAAGARAFYSAVSRMISRSGVCGLNLTWRSSFSTCGLRRRMSSKPGAYACS